MRKSKVRINMKKAVLAAAAAMTILPLSAQAQLRKLQEEQCLLYGSYAEHIVEGIELGVSEKQMIDANLKSKSATAEKKGDHE
jgi:hypothetical protein